MTPRLATCCLCFFPLLAKPSQGQILVGRESLHLGQTRAQVLTQLSDEFRLDSIASTGDQWVVESKAGPPFTLDAVVGFTAGRLSFVNRMWPIGGRGDQRETLTTVIRALSQLSGSSSHPCSVSASTSSEPSLELQSVSVSCGHHSINMIAGDAADSSAPTISESWSAEGPRK